MIKMSFKRGIVMDRIVKILSLIFIVLLFLLLCFIFIRDLIDKKSSAADEFKRYKEIIKLYLYDDNDGTLNENDIERLAKHLLYIDE